MRPFMDAKGRTELYLKAVGALRALMRDQDTDAASRAYAEAVAETYEADFAKKRGLKRSQERACVLRLTSQRCPGEHLAPPGGDHDTLWLKDGRPELYLMQPYGFGWDKMRELVAFCLQHGLKADVDIWPSFHFPGHVLSICLQRDKKEP